LRGQHAERVRIVQIERRVDEQDVVEGVEEVSQESDFQALFDRRLFAKRQVDIPARRASSFWMRTILDVNLFTNQSWDANVQKR